MDLTTEPRATRPVSGGDSGRVVVRRTGEIPCAAPFDFRHSLAFLKALPAAAGEQSIARGVLTRAVVASGQPIAIRMFQPRSADGSLAPKLRFALASSRPIDDATAAAAIDSAAFSLSADEKLSAFYALAEKDPPFARIARRLRGFHHAKLATPFEAACWAVLQRRRGVAAARQMKEALTEEYGAAIDLDDGTYLAFPDASWMARCDETRLCSILGSARKANALRALGRAFAGVSDDFLRTAPAHEVEAWLARIDGVGPWTAAFVLFRGLGRFERWPETPGFAAAIRSIYGRDLTSHAIANLGRRYARWGGHWMLYVWASTFASIPSA
jgi:DNA-3-methyladenine glycosylase II